jgi:hypothetical protein
VSNTQMDYRFTACDKKQLFRPRNHPPACSDRENVQQLAKTKDGISVCVQLLNTRLKMLDEYSTSAAKESPKNFPEDFTRPSVSVA